MFLHKQAEHGIVGDVRTMCLHPPTCQLSAEGIRVPVTVPRINSHFDHMSEVWSVAHFAVLRVAFISNAHRVHGCVAPSRELGGMQTEWVASPDGRWAAQARRRGIDIFSFDGALDGMHGAEADGR